MTIQQYRELQVWCQSNKSHPDYEFKVFARNEATAIRRRIIFAEGQIKNAMFVLEAAKYPDAIKKWTGIVQQYQNEKRELLKEFENL